MKRVILFRFGGGNFRLTKLIGAFLLFASLMMLFGAAALMFDSWDAMKNFPNCIKKAGQTTDVVLAQLKYMDCKDSLHDITGAQLKGDQTRLTSRQFWTGLLWPIANLFFWAIAFIVGIIMYRTGDIVLPIEQSVREIKK